MHKTCTSADLMPRTFSSIQYLSINLFVFYCYRNATFLEPHLQGVRRRDSRSSDSDHDERSTEDDERCLLRSSPRTRVPPPPPPPPDDDPPPLKPREFFERLQSQAMREAQEKKRTRELTNKDSLFRPVDADGSCEDSLSQVINFSIF